MAMTAAGIATSLSGCSAVRSRVPDSVGSRLPDSIMGGGNTTDTAEPEPQPDPEILEVTAEVGNFRQTQKASTTYILLRNNGRISEFRLTIKAQGQVAVYDEGEQVFSLEEDQELQTRFELFTHEGAEDLDIRFESTENPENYDAITINEETTPDKIDFTVN